MKKALIIKEFSGLADALLPLHGRDGWEIEVHEDYVSPEEINGTYPQYLSYALEVAQSGTQDLLIFEDPGSGAQRPVEHIVGWQNLVGGWNTGKDARRLELDRAYGKDVCAQVGIPFIPNSVFHKDELASFIENYGADKKVALKRNSGQLVGLGLLGTLEDLIDDKPQEPLEDRALLADHEALPLLLDYFDKTEQDNLIYTVEPLIDTSNAIEFSVCCLANGEVAIPVCTLFDLENKLFAGNLGPKISDVSQIIVPGVKQRWIDEIVKPMSEWVKSTNYKGWFDIDLMYLPNEDKAYCFEFMVRFAIPSAALIMKSAHCNWLEIFHRVQQGGVVEQSDFQWKDNISIGVGLFSFSTTFNSMTGDLPTGASVSGFEPYFRKTPSESDAHLVNIEMLYKADEDELVLAGDDGRHMYAVATGNDWRDALSKCYAVCEAVDYPNKVYKRNLFGYDSPITSDSDLAYTMPIMQQHILP